MTAKPPLPPQMHVVALRDPHVEASGHRPGSAYIEAVYLGQLGPSATWLWQRLARTATVRPRLSIDMVDLAGSLGLSRSLRANAALSRTIGRLQHFDVARRSGDTLAVRTVLPDLPAHSLGRMLASARFAHQHLSATARRRPPQPSVPGLDQAVGL